MVDVTVALAGKGKQKSKLYVYDKDHMTALRIKNTSESDPRSYQVTNCYK